jgi:hypothetical protein
VLTLQRDARTDRRNSADLSVKAGMYYLPTQAGSQVEKVPADPATAADTGIQVANRKIPGETGESRDAAPLASFENGIDLVDAHIATETPNSLSVDLHWVAHSIVQADATTFVQALSEEHQLLGQHDSYPVGGRYPTTLWSRGEDVFDTVALKLSRPLTPSDTIIVGWYVLPDADRRVLTTEGAPFVALSRRTRTLPPSSGPSPNTAFRTSVLD